MTKLLSIKVEVCTQLKDMVTDKCKNENISFQ